MPRREADATGWTLQPRYLQHVGGVPTHGIPGLLRITRATETGVRSVPWLRDSAVPLNSSSSASNTRVSIRVRHPGEENIYLTDALSRSAIRYVLVRHEQAASFMAEIYGRLTGKAGVCSATLGPGAINLLFGTADAYTNSTPVVAISAQVGLNRIYKESHQSVDLVSMFSPVTKWSDLILTPGAIPEMVRGRSSWPRPSVRDRCISAYRRTWRPPSSLTISYPSPSTHPGPMNPRHPRFSERPRYSTQASGLIILAGHGAARSGAAEPLRRFSELLGLPVATTFHGKGVFPDDHPHSLGAVGFMSHDYVNFGFDDADVIVSVGYELQEFDPVRINPAGDKQIIHLSRFPAEVDAHYVVEVGIQADIGSTLSALCETTTRHFDQGTRWGEDPTASGRRACAGSGRRQLSAQTPAGRR